MNNLIAVLDQIRVDALLLLLIGSCVSSLAVVACLLREVLRRISGWLLSAWRRSTWPRVAHAWQRVAQHGAWIHVGQCRMYGTRAPRCVVMETASLTIVDHSSNSNRQPTRT